MMKKLLKEYEAPLCDVVEVSLEGAVLNTSTVNETTGQDDSSNWGFVKNS